GPNGSGKSTLAAVLAGREGYAVTEGGVRYQGHDLLSMPADERARQGVFLAFQYPVEIPGVNNTYFLRAAVNAQRRHKGEPELDALRTVARGVNGLRAPDRAIVMITHYQRLLDYVEPDRVHVLQDGRIVQSGDKGLAAELERRGYGTVEHQAGDAA